MRNLKEDEEEEDNKEIEKVRNNGGDKERILNKKKC